MLTQLVSVLSQKIIYLREQERKVWIQRQRAKLHVSCYVAQYSPLHPVQKVALFGLVFKDSDFLMSSNNMHEFMPGVLYQIMAMPMWP